MICSGQHLSAPQPAPSGIWGGDGRRKGKKTFGPNILSYEVRGKLAEQQCYVRAPCCPSFWPRYKSTASIDVGSTQRQHLNMKLVRPHSPLLFTRRLIYYETQMQLMLILLHDSKWEQIIDFLGQITLIYICLLFIMLYTVYFHTLSY